MKTIILIDHKKNDVWAVEQICSSRCNRGLFSFFFPVKEKKKITLVLGNHIQLSFARYTTSKIIKPAFRELNAGFIIN